VVKATPIDSLRKFSTVVLKTLWKLALNSAHRQINTVLDAVCTRMKHFSSEIRAGRKIKHFREDELSGVERTIKFARGQKGAAHRATFYFSTTWEGAPAKY
jgi:hypothetical protein